MSAEADSPFGKLPVEMKSKLFTFLNNKARVNARLVCRSWLPIATEMVKFRAVITDETKQWIQECGYQLQSLSLQNLSEPFQMSSYFKTFPEIEEYIIGPGNSSQNILNFLRYFPSNIQNLTILNLALSNLKANTLPRALRGIEWSTLCSLSLAMKSEGIGKNDFDDFHNYPRPIKETYQNHSQAIMEILKFVRVKTLKNLTIEIFTGRAQETKKPWNHLVNFILEHSESLRELRLVLFGKPFLENPYTMWFYHSRGGHLTLADFRKLNLQKFSIEYDVYHGIFAQVLTTQMKGLECLDLQGDLRMMSRKGIEIEDDKYFAKALRTHDQNFNPGYLIGLHASTLKTIRGKFHLISLEWSGSFNNLKEIELKLIELRFFHGFPFFPALTKFCILAAHAPTFCHFPDIFIPSIVARMPNVEELELIFADRRCFEVHYLQDLRDLQKLRKVTIGRILGEWDDHSWKLYCDETPGLSFTRKMEDLSELSVKTPFDCAVIRIGGSKLCLSKGVQKVQSTI